MNKEIVKKEEMAKAILQGMDKIASVVARTLGPGGLPILIERQGVTAAGEPYTPMITKDGVSVAEECSDPDPRVDLVIQSVKAICKRTNRIAGDGTTTAIVLGQAILEDALKMLERMPELNPQMVRESIEDATQSVLTMLAQEAIPVTEPEKIAQVATISANGDQEIGSIIRQAFEAVGPEGVITVEEGNSPHTTINTIEGFQIKRGAEAQDRFYNNSDSTRFEGKDVHVLLYDSSLKSYADLLPPLNSLATICKASGKSTLPPILIVANDFSPEVIQFLLIQRAEANLSICAVKSPHMTTVRTGMLDDMAIMLGGYRLGNGNRDITAGTYQDFGRAERVVATKYTTTFYGGNGSEESVIARIDHLKAMKRSAESAFDASLVSDRIAALSNGVAEIGVGGMTELEVKERYHRIEDALNSARSAVELGVIPGGGIPLYRIANRLMAESSEHVGKAILSVALRAPLLQILQNIGKNPNEVLTEEVLARIEKEPHLVYDARNKVYANAFDAGILDAVKVTSTALQNACSIAALLSTCGGAILFTRDSK